MVFAVAAVLVLGVAGVAAAAPWGVGLGWGPRGGDAASCVKAIANLNLTDEQVSKIQEIQASAFEQLKGVRDALSQKMFELQQLMWQKSPDQDAIAAKQAEVKELRQKMLEIQKSVQEQMKGVLTQEQLDKLQQGKGFGRGHGPGHRGGFSGAPPSGNGSAAPSGAAF